MRPAEPASALPAKLLPAATQQPARVVDSARLFEGASEVLIDHHGVIYRLKRTALGKLILTK